MSHFLVQTRKQTFHEKHSQVLSDSLFHRQIAYLLKSLRFYSQRFSLTQKNLAPGTFLKVACVAFETITIAIFYSLVRLLIKPKVLYTSFLSF